MTRQPGRHLFVTGRPGVGKTTLVRAVLGELDADAGGFTTVEVRDGGRRIGFDIIALSGERGVLARVGLESLYRVARYGVNREDLERVGVAALERAIKESELVVMDEIGRMELCSEAFQEAVMRALDSGLPALGTIQDRHNAFLDAVRSREDVRIVRVTEENRDGLLPVLVEEARRYLTEARARSNRPGRLDGSDRPARGGDAS